MERHDFDPVSLIFGLVFLGLASTGLFQTVDLSLIQARWLWPILLIVAGGSVLASSIRRPVSDDGAPSNGSVTADWPDGD